MVPIVAKTYRQVISLVYKDAEKQRIYLKGYYAGWRIATIYHLGGKCELCGETDIYKLTIDHDPPLKRKDRTVKDLADLKLVRVRCEACHPDLVRRTRKK